MNLVLKELQQLRRDRAAKFRLLIPTLVQLFIFGYAATFEVYNVATVVLDLDHSQESREKRIRKRINKAASRDRRANRPNPIHHLKAMRPNHPPIKAPPPCPNWPSNNPT